MTFGFLDLRLPAPAGAGETQPAPFHLVYPETLGTVPVRTYLLAPDPTAAAMLGGRVLAGSPLGKPEQDLLRGHTPAAFLAPA